MTNPPMHCATSCEALRNLNSDVARLELVVDGDELRDVRGIRQRLTTLETAVEELLDERAATRQRMTGLIIGVGIASTTGVGTLVVTVAKIWMGLP